MRGAVIDGYLSPNYIVRAHNSPQSLALVTGGISYGDRIPQGENVVVCRWRVYQRYIVSE